MPTIGEKPLWKPGDPIQLLVWGRSKIGKTFGAGTAPRPNFIDFDDGLATIQGPEFIGKYGWRPTIRYGQFAAGERTSRGVIRSPKAYDSACMYFDEEMSKHKDEFDTWVLDTGTTLVEAASAKALFLLGGTFKGISSTTLNEGIQHGLIVPKQQDYAAERSMTEQFIDMLRSSGKNLIVLCHEAEESTPAGSVVARGPLFTGKSKEQIPLMFNEVYRLEARKQGTETIRELTTRTDGINKVGSRLGVPDKTKWEWDAVYQAIMQGYTNLTKQGK